MALEPIVLTLTLVLNQGVTNDECRAILYNTYPPDLIQELANHKTTFACQLDVMGRLRQLSLENDAKLDRKYKRETAGREIYEICGDQMCRVEQRDPLLERASNE